MNLLPVQIVVAARHADSIREVVKGIPWPVGDVHNLNGILWLRIKKSDGKWGDFKKLGKAPGGWKIGDKIPKEHLQNVPEDFLGKVNAASQSHHGEWQQPVKKVPKPKVQHLAPAPAPAAPAAKQPQGKAFPPKGYAEDEWGKMDLAAKLAAHPKQDNGESAPMAEKEAWDKADYEKRAGMAKEHFIAQIIAARQKNFPGHDTAGAFQRYMKYDAHVLARRAKQYIGNDPNGPKQAQGWEPKPQPKQEWKPDPAAVITPADDDQKGKPGHPWYEGLQKASVEKHKTNAEHGVNPSYIVSVKTPDGKEKKGVFKKAGSGDPVESEYGAFLIDRALGINRVPNVVMREFEMKAGPLDGQKVKGTWMEFADGAVVAHAWGDAIPKDELARIAVLDHVCGNVDRHGGNYMVYPDGKKVAAIDNGRCFWKGGAYPVYSEPWSKLNKYGDFEPPKDIMDAIKSLDLDKLKADLSAAGLKQGNIANAVGKIEEIRKSGKVVHA